MSGLNAESKLTGIPTWVPLTVPKEQVSAFRGWRRPCEGDEKYGMGCVGSDHVSAVCVSEPMANGLPMFRYRCTTCGRHVSSNCKQLKGVEVGTQKELERLKALVEVHECEVRDRAFGSFRQKYADYLDSESWAKKRKRVFERDGGRCRICGSGERLVGHHRSYQLVDFKGGEPESDVITVCEGCHDAIHWLNPHERANFEEVKEWEGHGKFPPPP